MKNTKQGKGQKKNREVPRRRAFPWPLLFSVLFGAAALLLILGLLGAGKAAFFDKFSQIAKGLFGSLRAVSPLAFIWMCVQCARRAARRSVPVLRILADGLLILCLLAAVEIFFCAKVEEEKGVALSAFDFVRKAYDVGRGGGAAGGVLAYPLYKGVGKWLGFILILLACVLQLILTGRLKRLLGCFRSGGQSDDSMLDHAFDEPAAPPKKPRQASSRSRSLYREDIVESPAPRPSRPDPAKADSQAPKTAGNRRRSVEYDGIGDDKPRAEDAKKQPPVQEEASKPKESKPETVKPEYVPGAKPRPAPKRTGETAKEDPEMEHLHIEPDNYEPILPEDEPVSKPLPKFKRPEPVQKEAEEGYNYPPIDLLEEGARSEASADSSADLQKAHLLEDTLKSFGIATKLTGIAHGPAVTRFELQPAPGVKVSRITSLSDDIALNLAALSVRIEAPIPGKAAVGVEVPNDKIETVSLRDVLESPDARKHTSRVAVGLGKDNSGRYIIADVAKMPHVLIAGQTGSGKSVCINSIIVSILYRASPDEVKLILIDPKVVELSVYNGIPHLIAPVVTDPRKAASALDWAVVEMTNRYKKFAERGVRDIKGYNKALKDDEKPMPHMVIIIDELADLMMVSPGEVEDSICRLAQLARAAGMHLVIATQRPSVNVITGIIKANIPTRIAFLVASQVDSRTIIDHGGAEKLLGHGDMLYVPAGIQKPMRVQGSWVSDEEVHAIVEYIKERHEADYDEDVLEHINNAVKSDAEKEEAADEYDPRLPEAIEIVMEAGQASISMLQRRMRVGYARAGRLIDEMYQRGIVSEGEGAKPRNVTITREQFNQMFDGEN